MRFILSSALFWRLMAILWTVILYLLSSQPRVPIALGFSGVDKIEHVTYFALGGMGFLLSLRRGGGAPGRTIAVVLTVLFCSFVGVLDEWHQLYVPGRSGGDVWDWLADTFGGFLGAYAGLGVEKRLTSASTTRAPL
ncbi:MAG: VanZ family protein [Prosthecobacter sp.]